MYELVCVSTAVFADAIGVLEAYDDQALGFTDATIIAAIERHDLDAVMSFDDNFDGLVERIDPAVIW